jgi:uncharacterized protein YndB with AHSA1/START domain
MRYEYKDFIDKPPTDVFEQIADVDRKHEWVGEVQSSRMTSDGPVGVGSTFEDTVKFMGRTSVIPTVFTAYEPGTKIAYRHLDGPIKADLEYDLQAEGEGTRLTIVIDAILPWYMRLLGPLLSVIMKRVRDHEASDG